MNLRGARIWEEVQGPTVTKKIVASGARLGRQRGGARAGVSWPDPGAQGGCDAVRVRHEGEREHLGNVQPYGNAHLYVLPCWSAVMVYRVRQPCWSTVLVCHAGAPRWSAVLVCRADPPRISAALVCRAGTQCWPAALVCRDCPPRWPRRRGRGRGLRRRRTDASLALCKASQIHKT